MDSAVTLVVLLGCCPLWTSAGGRSAPFSMVFSGGTRLLVDADEGDGLHHRNETKGLTSSHGPSVQILRPVPLSGDPGSPVLLVCLLSGLKSPVQKVLWWVGDAPVTSPDTSLMRSGEGGAYSATSLWEVSPSERRSTYWCGTVQGGQVYRQKLCSEDGL